MSVRRSWLVGVLTCGAVLVPASGAFADHMGEMADGMICPHAAGNVDATGGQAPAQAAAPERAGSEAPIAAAGQGAPSSPAPASSPAPPSEVSTQVTAPATQAEAQGPATAAVEAATPTAVPQAVAVAATAEQSAAAAAERARERRAARRAAAERARRVAERRAGRMNRQRLANIPAGFDASPPAAPTRVEPAVAATPGGTVPTAVLVALAFVALAGAATALARRRRRSGGAAAIERHAPPSAPSYADALVEAELHEMIAEARARELTGKAAAGPPA